MTKKTSTVTTTTTATTTSAPPEAAAATPAPALDCRRRANEQRPVYRVYRMFLDIVFGVALVVAAGYGSYHVMKPTTPRVIEDIWVEPTSQIAGRSFNVHIKVFMNQICTDASVHWSLIRTKDNEVVSQSVQTGKKTALGESIIVNERLIPASVPAGEYFYQSTVFDNCGTGASRITYTTTAPKVYIKVL